MHTSTYEALSVALGGHTYEYICVYVHRYTSSQLADGHTELRPASPQQATASHNRLQPASASLSIAFCKYICTCCTYICSLESAPRGREKQRQGRASPRQRSTLERLQAGGKRSSKGKPEFNLSCSTLLDKIRRWPKPLKKQMASSSSVLERISSLPRKEKPPLKREAECGDASAFPSLSSLSFRVRLGERLETPSILNDFKDHFPCQYLLRRV